MGGWKSKKRVAGLWVCRSFGDRFKTDCFGGDLRVGVG